MVVDYLSKHHAAKVAHATIQGKKNLLVPDSPRKQRAGKGGSDDVLSVDTIDLFGCWLDAPDGHGGLAVGDSLGDTVDGVDDLFFLVFHNVAPFGFLGFENL